MPLWLLLAAASAWKAAAVLTSTENQGVFVANFAAGCAVIFFGGLFLHSWLCRLRPGAESLTAYYLCIALGGAVGGFLSGIVPVFIFSTAAEYPLSLALLGCAAPVAIATNLAPSLEKLREILFPRTTGTAPWFRAVRLAFVPAGVSALNGMGAAAAVYIFLSVAIQYFKDHPTE